MQELLLLLSVFTATILGTVNETETTNEDTENTIEVTTTEEVEVGIPSIVVF